MNIIEALEVNKTKAVIGPLGERWSIGEMSVSSSWSTQHVIGNWELAPKEVWVNEYAGGVLSVYDSREEAVRWAADICLRVGVHYREVIHVPTEAVLPILETGKR